MRFLFINQYYSPDYAATAQQLSDLCERLAAMGHEVHVLTSRAIYDGRDLELPEKEILNGVHVHRLGLSSKGRDRIRQRLMGYLSFYTKAFIRVNFLPKPDVIVTLTTPPMISLLGTWLRLTRRSRFVYWVMDIYPDIAINAGMLRPFGPISAIWSTLGRISYKTANRVVVLGRDMRDMVAAKRISPHKIDVINSWSNGEQVRPIAPEKNEFRREHLNPEAFCLMYSGNMGTCHEFKSVIAGIKDFAGSGEVHFAFVGGGKQLPALKKALESQKENVKFLPYQDRESLALSLSAPDAHLVTLQPQYDGLLVPSKVYGIMAAGRAILFVGSETNEIARIISRSKCGMIVSPDDSNGFAEAVRWMATHREEVQEMGKQGREHFELNYDVEVGTLKFAQLLEKAALEPGVRGVRRLAHEAMAAVHLEPAGGSQPTAAEFAKK